MCAGLWCDNSRRVWLPPERKLDGASTCELTLAVAGCSDSLVAHVYDIVPHVSGLSRSRLVLVRCLVRFVCDTKERRKVVRGALIVSFESCRALIFAWV